MSSQQKSQKENIQEEPELTELKETKAAADNGDCPPDDVRAFFGHPLTAATTAINGEDAQASAVALLHEYMNLPAIDKSGVKIMDMLSPDVRKELMEGAAHVNVDVSQYLQMLLQSDLEKYFIDGQTEPTLSPMISIKVKDEVNSRASCDRHIPSSDGSASTVVTEAGKQKSCNVSNVGTVLQETPKESKDSVINAAEPRLQASFNGHPFQPTDLTVTSEQREFCNKDKALTGDCHRDQAQEQSQPSQLPQPEDGEDGVSISGTDTEEKRNDVSKEALKALTEKLLRKRLGHPDMTNHANLAESSAVSAVQGYMSHPMAVLNNNNNKIMNYALKPEGFMDQLNGELPPVYELGARGGLGTTPVTTCGATSLTQPQQNADSMIVQSSQGQYFQVLQPVQAVDPLATDCMNNVYYQPTYPATQTLGLEPDKQNMSIVEKYVQQQQQYTFQNQNFQQYLSNGHDNYNMKSPDSGYQEPCLSPTNGTNGVKEANGTFETCPPSKEKATTKKRRSSSQMTMFMRQYSNSDKVGGGATTIAKLDSDPTGYKYFMETPTSTTQRIEEDRITYLNKGQYYGLTLECKPPDQPPKNQVVKSIITVVFREEKTAEDEQRAWEFWHSRQHSYKQRILDIDTKNCQGITSNNIDEFAFNAAVVRWNPCEGPVRVNIAIHCLSTDFSNQKGVKGIPLHVQIDTYENPKDMYPVSRGYLQIKVFCDKGAERKTRDEERRKAAKVKSDNFSGVSAPPGARKKHEEIFHKPLERSEFYPMADLYTVPVYFKPNLVSLNNEPDDFSKISPLPPDEESSSLPSLGEGTDTNDFYPVAKRQRRDSCSQCRHKPKILLYARERHEKVFTALLLRTATMFGLLQAIEEKYHIPTAKVKHFYKKSKKGILVKMDDNIIRHYSHESTFIIEINQAGDDRSEFEIILIENDPPQ